MAGASTRTGAAAISASWPAVQMQDDRPGQHNPIFTRLGQRFENCAPSSSLGPAIEAIVDRSVRAVLMRAIAPSRTRLQHANDAADDAPVVVPIRPCQSRQQMRFDRRPLPAAAMWDRSVRSRRAPSTRSSAFFIAADPFAGCAMSSRSGPASRRSLSASCWGYSQAKRNQSTKLWPENKHL